MRPRPIPASAIVLALAALATPLMAQSINIDLGPASSGPSDFYRAAGLPGHWHSFEATEWGVFHDLVDLQGNPTTVRVRQIGGTEILVKELGGLGQPQGGDANLLGDALITHQVENCLFFEGLQHGTYEVLSYTWMPTAPATLNHVWIDFHPDEPLIGGNWPGQLSEGIVYARHEYTTSDGIINMHSGIPDGADAFPGAALNGIQLRLMGDEPPLFVEPDELGWLRALDAVSYDVVRGDLGTLRATGGDFAASVEACLIGGTSDRTLAYADTPETVQGDWFLVRGRRLLGALTWNAPGGNQVGSRDLELSAACP